MSQGKDRGSAGDRVSQNLIRQGPCRRITATMGVCNCYDKWPKASGQHPTTGRKVRAAQARCGSGSDVQDGGGDWLARNKPEWSGHHHERNLGLLTRIVYKDLGSAPYCYHRANAAQDTPQGLRRRDARVGEAGEGRSDPSFPACHGNAPGDA